MGSCDEIDLSQVRLDRVGRFSPYAEFLSSRSVSLTRQRDVFLREV